MQIDTQLEEFSDISDLTEETEEMKALFVAAMAEGKIIAKSDSKESLHKLQEDLRKAGYRRMFAK